MGATLDYTETLVVTHCWCGIALAIPSNLHRVAQDEGKSVYCPLGHSFHYGGSYKEQLAEEQRRCRAEERRHQATRDLLRAEERSHTATRGHLTRAQKRAAAGVCPCCHRTFANVARHVASKHPDFPPGAES
jgi:hypothetical protein